MKITGSYNNYVHMSNLLSSLGVKGSGDMVMSVFASSMENLTSKIDEQIFSKESAAAVSQLYNSALSLSSKVSKLTQSDANSVFNDRTAVSSDADVLTASAYDALSADTGATEAVYEISVSQTAQAQNNTGVELQQAEASVVGLGTNTFNINIDGQDHELSIEVVDGDTNEAVLQKMETAINDAGLGITAEVVAGSEQDTQQLVVTSDNTGAAQAFSISDVSGNAIASTGADTTSTASQDAAYAVNGTDYTSAANTIYLDDDMVTVNLKAAGDATLTVAPDPATVEDTVSALVSELNSFLDFLESNTAYFKDDALSSVNAYIEDHKSDLNAMGITLSENGRLELDAGKLGSAVNQDFAGVKETFGGFDGLAVQLSNYTAGIVFDDPLKYAKEAENININSLTTNFNSSTNMIQQLLQGSLLDIFI